MMTRMNNPGNLNGTVPLFFGVSPKRLYGCHHIPQGMNTRTCGVVLCPPLGQEYIQSHRVIYQFAVRLSRVGFHVLRFDYFGCGDSEGDCEQGEFSQWIEDIHAAIGELNNRSGLKSVCLIGLRIGATLSLEAADNFHNICGMVLWEPILDGRVYLMELDKRQRQQQFFLNKIHGKRRLPLARSETDVEVLGFPLTPGLRRDLEKVKMDLSKLPYHSKSLIVSNSKNSKFVRELRTYTQDNPRIDFQIMDDRMAWEDARIIPIKTVGYLVDWMEKAFS